MLPTLYYCYDPLCGWCYGFMPVIQRVQQQVQGSYTLRILCGGMVMGENVGAFGERADYIHQASQRITQLTGVEFGEEFYRNILFNPEYQNNSEPPCLALVAFKQYNNSIERHLEFAHRMQVWHYRYGVDLNDDKVYRRLAEDFGLDADEFLRRMKSPQVKNAMYQELLLVSEIGVTGFPTTVLEQEGKFSIVAEGYADEESLLRILPSSSSYTALHENSTCNGSK